MKSSMSQKSASLYVMAALASMVAGCSSHMHAPQARLYADAITAELVKAGACADVEVCQQNEMVKWEAGGWKLGALSGGGVTLQVYRIADSTIADAVIARCRKIHSANPEVTVSLSIQSNAHIDNLHPGERTIVREARFQERKASDA